MNPFRDTIRDLFSHSALTATHSCCSDDPAKACRQGDDFMEEKSKLIESIFI